MYKIKLDNIDLLFSEIAKKYPLYIPAEDETGRAKYTKWDNGVKYSDQLNTARSPKDFFFPQTEDLMRFKTQEKTIEITDIREEKADFVIFGVRACDVKSFEVLDNVFLKDYNDSYYQNSREHGIIISLSCQKPSETCFCQTFGIDPAEPGADVSGWEYNGYLYLKPLSEKGAKLAEVVKAITEEADEKEVEPAKEKTRKIMAKLPLASLTVNGFGKGKTKELFDRAEWDTLSQSCLGCGTCTFVCPTCQCYDIRDLKTKSGVLRYRCWDSCMYSDFTKMSAGQPRPTQKERFRQRFMHKLVYYPENNDGLFSCVGCGRCLQRCPISMNIVKVMKTFGGKCDE